jgi:hypothetical protein
VIVHEDDRIARRRVGDKRNPVGRGSKAGRHSTTAMAMTDKIFFMKKAIDVCLVFKGAGTTFVPNTSGLIHVV